MNPIVFSCGYSGLIFGLVSFKNMLILASIGAVLYFGWPVVEKVLVKLPIPDPKDLADKMKNVFSKSKGPSAGGKKNDQKGDYEKGFGRAPESL